MDELKNRKTTRLKGADYNQNQAVFLTICTKERKCILSRIVGTGVLDGPSVTGGLAAARSRSGENDYQSFSNTLAPLRYLDGPSVTGFLDGPQIELTKYGQIADKYINQLDEFYDDLSVESYVIMPNHIHIMLWVKGAGNGPSGTPVPTVQNSVPSRFVSTFKRFCNKEYGVNIWQYRSNDHIIRNRQDYDEHLRYIYENPIRWYYDELYAEE